MPTSNERKMLSSNEALKELNTAGAYITHLVHHKIDELLLCLAGVYGSFSKCLSNNDDNSKGTLINNCSDITNLNGRYAYIIL